MMRECYRGKMCLKWLEVIIGCQTETHAHSDSGTVKKTEMESIFLSVNVTFPAKVLCRLNETKAMHRHFRVILLYSKMFFSNI